MSTVPNVLIERLRRSEYTGSNRCVPCTTLNLVVVGVAAAVLGSVRPVLGVGLAIVGVLSVWLRGYLIPGTPWLTANYLPRQVLALFDKEPAAERASMDAGAAGETVEDPETVLLESGLLVVDPSGADLLIAPDVGDDLRAAAAAVNAGPSDEETLSRLAGIPTEELRFGWEGDAYVARLGHEKIAVWESRSAFVADAAADQVFADRIPGYADESLARRTALLGAFRIFLDRCPTCHGEITVGRDVVTSCCASYDVVAGTCAGCNDRLFEIEVDGTDLA